MELLANMQNWLTLLQCDGCQGMSQIRSKCLGSHTWFLTLYTLYQIWLLSACFEIELVFSTTLFQYSMKTTCTHTPSHTRAHKCQLEFHVSISYVFTVVHFNSLIFQSSLYYRMCVDTQQFQPHVQ